MLEIMNGKISKSLSEELGRILIARGQANGKEEINNDLLLIDPLGDMWDIENDIDF